MTKERNIALIGRGESVLMNGTPAENMLRQATLNEIDVDTYLETTEKASEGDEEGGVGIRQDSTAGEDPNHADFHEDHSILQESAGWVFPKVKLAVWDPENEKQWASYGSGIARRNLIASIPNLTCAFGVWLVWSGKCILLFKLPALNPTYTCRSPWPPLLLSYCNKDPKDAR